MSTVRPGIVGGASWQFGPEVRVLDGLTFAVQPHYPLRDTLWTTRFYFDYGGWAKLSLRVTDEFSATAVYEVENTGTRKADLALAKNDTFTFEVQHRPDSAWWDSFVYDPRTGEKLIIGGLEIPPTEGITATGEMYLEFDGRYTDCAAIPYSSATFSPPRDPQYPLYGRIGTPRLWKTGPCPSQEQCGFDGTIRDGKMYVNAGHLPRQADTGPRDGGGLPGGAAPVNAVNVAVDVTVTTGGDRR